MKRKDIDYINGWEKAKCFKKTSVAEVFKGLVEGIWICPPGDPEDIILVYPSLERVLGENEYLDKTFGTCPVEFKFNYFNWKGKKGKYEIKYRDINSFGLTWHTDLYEMRKAVTRRGLDLAKQANITKEEVEALVARYGYNDKKAYKKLLKLRPELGIVRNDEYIAEWEYQYIRAAFCPNLNPLYNWMDDPEKAGIHRPSTSEE